MPAREIVLAGADERDLTKLDEYRAAGGFQALAKARSMEPQAVIDEVLASNLRGRGGAFFATGRKASFIPKPEQTPKPIYLVINADESEPGTFKDREIMLRVPHRFLEGALITAHAIQSKNVFVYIRGEYLTEFEVLRAALEKKSDLEFVAVNDLTDAKTLAYLLKYDSVHGTFSGKVTAGQNSLTVDGREIRIFSNPDPAEIPWEELAFRSTHQALREYLTRP